jgi:hypothetical protein
MNARTADRAAAAARLGEAATEIAAAESQLDEAPKLRTAITKLAETAGHLADGDDKAEASLLREEVIDVRTRVKALAEEAEDIRVRATALEARLSP